MCFLANITPDVGVAFGAALAARIDDGWTPRRVARLKALWRDGLAPQAIAAALGMASASVRSKAYRLQEAGDLERHPNPTAHQRGATIGQATRQAGEGASFWAQMARSDRVFRAVLTESGIRFDDDPRAASIGELVWIRVWW